MAIAFHRESATIHQFPIKAVQAQNRFERFRMMEREAAGVCDALDSCWYHDEAVRTDDKTSRS